MSVTQTQRADSSARNIPQPPTPSPAFHITMKTSISVAIALCCAAVVSAAAPTSTCGKDPKSVKDCDRPDYGSCGNACCMIESAGSGNTTHVYETVRNVLALPTSTAPSLPLDHNLRGRTTGQTYSIPLSLTIATRQVNDSPSAGP